MSNEEAVRELIATVDTWYRENIWPNEIPPGTFLRMHPAVLNMIRQATSLADYSGPEAWKKKLRLPVKVEPYEMPEYTWQIVTITEKIHAGGEMPHGMGID